MDQRTTTIVLGGKERRLLCDNAAVLRFERAGGNLSSFDSAPLGNTCLFIRANLADAADRREFADEESVMNALESMQVATSVVEGIFTGSTFFDNGEKKSGASGPTATSGPRAS